MKSFNIYKVCLVKEKSFRYDFEGKDISCASDAAGLLRGLGLADSADEEFYILCLNTKGKVAGIHQVSHGQISSCAVHPREVFKRALVNNASAIILAHNHPSGDPEPSTDDALLTETMEAAGKLLGIRILDHIILGEDSYYSFAGTGRMSN